MTLRSEGMGCHAQVKSLGLRRCMGNSFIVTGGKAGCGEGKWVGDGEGTIENSLTALIFFSTAEESGENEDSGRKC